MAEGTNPDPVLAQLAILTQLIESQNARLDNLERGNAGATGQDVNAHPAGVGDPSRSDNPPLGNNPGIGESTGPPQPAELARGDNALTSQYGIRATDPWKTDSALSKDPFKCSFKLESAKDYMVWKFAMSKLLDKEGLLSFAMGTAVKPYLPENPSAEEVRLFYRWQEFNNACESAILSSVGKSQLGLLVSCRTAQEMWGRLQRLYMHPSEVNVARLEDELHSIRWKKNTTVDSYIQEIDRIANSLRECGQEVSENRLKMTLLRGLPDRLDNIKHLLLQLGPQPYVIVCDYLRAHVGLSSTGDSKAYVSSTDKGSQSSAHRKPKEKDPDAQPKTSTETCKFCKKTGHSEEKCFKKNPCKICKKTGHSEQRCKEKNAKEEETATAMLASHCDVSPKAFNVATDDEWLMDSGATHHMCHDLSLFSNQEQETNNKGVYLGNATRIPVTLTGEVHMELQSEEGQGNIVAMKNVLGVEGLAKNLFSVSACLSHGFNITFQATPRLCKITKDNRVWGTAHEKRGLWVLDCKTPETASFVAHSHKPESLDKLREWHNRMGHLNYDSLKMLVSKGLVKGLNLSASDSFNRACITCNQGKQSRLPFPTNSGPSSSHVLELVHSDLVGPVKPSTFRGCKYILSFVDDFSHMAWTFLLSYKSDVFSTFVEWKTGIENWTGKKIKMLRTDNGTEYLNSKFEEYMKAQGVRHQTTVPYTPQQNGVAERWNRTLLETARSLIHGAGPNVPQSLWGEAVAAATLIRNCCPTKGGSTLKTPHESFYGLTPDVSHFRTWGCRTTVLLESHERSKFGSKILDGILVGYSQNQKGYRIYQPKTHKLLVARNVRFLETEFLQPVASEENESHFQWPEQWGGDLEIPEDPPENPSEDPVMETEDDTHHSPLPLLSLSHSVPQILPAETLALPFRANEDSGEPTETENIPDEPTQSFNPQDNQGTGQDIQPPLDEPEQEPESSQDVPVRRSTRESKKPETFGYDKLGQPNSAASKYQGYLVTAEDKLTLYNALSGSERDNWESAILQELQSLADNKTWTLQKLPAGRKAVGCRWLFKKKDNPDGSIRYKARLVAKGYTQIEGLDYSETYAPVLKYQSLRIMLAIANEEKMHVHHVDITTAFLYGDLKEEIYLEQPEGYKVKGREFDVCRLHKSLYGLKQSPRCWNTTIHSFLLSNDFKVLSADTAVYVNTKFSSKIMVSLFVDDILVYSPDLKLIKFIKDRISASFKVTDYGEVSTILGIKVIRDILNGTLSLSQELYASRILERFNMAQCEGKSNPLSPGLKLSVDLVPATTEEKKTMSKTPYREAVGSLMYLMLSTRPDIAAAVQFVSRFGADPSPQHWEVVKTIMKYVQKTKDATLTFKKQGVLQITGYCDSDWQSCVDTRRSNTGYVFLIGGAAVSWSSKRQRSVTLSSCEAEYVAACEATRELIWETAFIRELGYSIPTPIVHMDSQSALQLIHNPVFHDKSKHIQARMHYVRERVQEGEVTFQKIKTDLNISDSLTKGVNNAKTIFCRLGMGLIV